MRRKVAKPTFKPYTQAQPSLIPPSWDELIPANHQVRVVNRAVEQINLEPMLKKYKGGGTSSYHPRMMMKVLVYAYTQRIYSSRQIAKGLRENVNFMWLSGGNRPDFRTINEFRGEKMKGVIFDAYRQNLVKNIQVFGVTERENFNQPFFSLQEVSINGGIKARIKAYVEDQGRAREREFTLKYGEDVYEKTRREEHKSGYKVMEINAAQKFIKFENGLHLVENETIGPSRPEVFRVQIRQTIQQHIEMQERMRPKGIKVLSLFFIDRVANYTSKEGIIRRIFDEEFERLKRRTDFYQELTALDVREAYFAKKKPKKGKEKEAIDTSSRTQEEREAEKAAFELIMRDKERLLSFGEKKCFIFAHSALKEGWDNPNVFQICTLNQTVSEIKKRQEIGRGLRLAVNQQGERVFEEDVNIPSVIANESYQSYAAGLQSEYRETGDAAPPPPRDRFRRPAKRNEKLYVSQVFRDFWAKLQNKIGYRIHVDTPTLIQACIERINIKPTPQAVIVVE